MKKNLSSRKNTLKLLDQIKGENTEPYQIGHVKLKSGISESSFEGMQVFTVNDQKSTKQKVILYLHGGAFVYQPLRYHWKFMDKLARALNAKFIVPIYPKVPGFTYQQTYPRLVNLYREILESVENPAQLTFMGDSAGGNISLALAQVLKVNQLPQPKDIILLSACVDMVLDNPVIFDYETRDPMLAVEGFDVIKKIWAADKSLYDPLISPLYGSFEELGKITIFVGTYEGLFPDNMRLSKRLTDQKIEHHTLFIRK